MVRASIYSLVSLTFAALVLGVPRPAGADSSLCLVAGEGCLTPGDIQIKVIVESNDAIILGGQITVSYDPYMFSLVEAAPGRVCDATSPFALELLVDDDPLSGEVRCAFGVDLKKGLPPAAESTTLACLSFAPIGDLANPSKMYLLKGENPFETALVDQTGHRLLIDNSLACPPDSPPPILACVEATPGVNCSCVPDTADCHALDTPCRIGVCNSLTSRCDVLFVNEGGLCDDGDPSTAVDRCTAGTCVGGDYPQIEPFPSPLHLLQTRPVVSH